ncbi:purine and uridine phosphorylase [Aspergillus lentulus]|uniref:Purine and uridine phosphorylase n=1 Tax=Aspergillus lentulus TaxID=293939 RepID=A0ABQ1ABF4_ASPLE|nr:purine and uridine phosphorylase [Aspergillus lentulus]GFG04209.1 purine and uridine phosphorylase [Aspergillus lentulus]
MTMPCPARDEFQIGWICALPIEAAAAKEMLDEDFGILEEQDAADTNSYRLGKIGKHYVVIACLPAGQYGACAATTVASNMVRTFSKSLRIGLMVGVGGGIPSPDHDIRLGDIVISCPTGTCGGVIQYDMGKVTADGVFCRTGSLNSPPRSLLTAVSQMRAAELADDPLYLKYLQTAIRRTRRTQKNFGRPSSQSDRLFKTKHEHPGTLKNCDMCSRDWEETRSERDSQEPLPHYGIIASGNSVIRHGGTREQLHLESGALCFKMEAAGLMLDFPCIIIRGIYNYSDSHKNKQWQGYAALAAASYTKELLSYMPCGQVSQEILAVDVCSSIENLTQEVKGTNQRLDTAYDQQERHYREQTARVLTEQQQKCHQVFKTSNYEQHKDINPGHVPGTCQWALQNPHYLHWWNSRCNDFLWISADPGCGKSVLAKSLIDDDLGASSSTVSICYFFFKDNGEQNNLATSLCAILHQLFSQQPNLLQHALPSWERNGNKLQQEAGELWRIFIAATSDPASANTICVLDALDECHPDDQKQLIHRLEDFCHRTDPSTLKTWLKFLVTSRPYDEVKDKFKAIRDSFPHIHLKGEEENDQIREEVNLVVRMRVKELAETASLSSDVQQRLEHQLLQMEHRTYLWLYLAINDIRTTLKYSLLPAEESVRLIPPSVDAAYEKILARVPSNQIHTVRKILQIIVGARRPLTTQEMAMALGIALSPRSQTAAEAGINPVRLAKRIRQLCGLFVFINNSKIYLIHQTAREFLVCRDLASNPNSIYAFKQTDAEKLMSQVCLQYLLMDDLEQSYSENQRLLEYSAVHWADHVRNVSLTQQHEIDDLLHRIYDTAKAHFAVWFPIVWMNADMFWDALEILPDTAPHMDPIHLAAFNGHTRMVMKLLAENRNSIDEGDNTGWNALMWASLNGDEEVAELLLELGADANVQGGECGSALQAASVGGHEEVIQVLLEQGANANAQGGFYGNALQAASIGGHENIVQMLLDHGANANAQGGVYDNALQAASKGGYEKLVQVLLDHGADANAQGGLYGNALQAASMGGHEKVIQMLLDHRADTNAQGGFYGNALQAASMGGHEKVVQVLLDHGADANAQGGDYGNALQAASMEGHEKVVQVLLDHGADANAQGGGYGNALQAASVKGHKKVVQMLQAANLPAK